MTIFGRLRSSLAIAALIPCGVATAQNLIRDPTFSSGIGAWTTRGALPSRLDWNGGPGADGAVGFARLSALTGGPGAFFGRVCLPARPGVVYLWGGYLRFLSAPDASAQFTLSFSGDSACAGPILLHAGGPQLSGSLASPNTWYLRPGQDVAAPSGANSVSFEIQLTTLSNPLRSVDFDNVYFGPPAVVPMLSISNLLLLAAAMAAVGLWRLASR